MCWVPGVRGPFLSRSKPTGCSIKTCPFLWEDTLSQDVRLCQQLSDRTLVTPLHGASRHGVPAMGSRSPRVLGSRTAPWQASGFAFTLVIAGEENPRVPVAEGWTVSSCSQRPETTGQRAGRRRSCVSRGPCEARPSIVWPQAWGSDKLVLTVRHWWLFSCRFKRLFASETKMVFIGQEVITLCWACDP